MNSHLWVISAKCSYVHRAGALKSNPSDDREVERCTVSSRRSSAKSLFPLSPLSLSPDDPSALANKPTRHMAQAQQRAHEQPHTASSYFTSWVYGRIFSSCFSISLGLFEPDITASENMFPTAICSRLWILIMWLISGAGSCMQARLAAVTVYCWQEQANGDDSPHTDRCSSTNMAENHSAKCLISRWVLFMLHHFF